MKKNSAKFQKKLTMAVVLAVLVVQNITMQKSDALELKRQNVGLIDVNYVVNNSKITQALKTKQDSLTIELQKYSITEKEKMLSSQTSLNKQDVEKELIKKVSLKKSDLEKEYKENFVLVQQKVKTAVEEVQKKKQLDLVFTKDSLVSGGVDITKDVIEVLDAIK